MDKSIVKAGVLMLALCVSFSACKTDAPQVAEKSNLGFDVANLDSSVSPCDDFFQFMAGGWIRNNPIPETESRWSNFNILLEENNAKVKLLLDSVSALKPENTTDYARKLATYYNSGLDSTAVENAGLTPLNAVFEKIKTIQSPSDYVNLMGFFKANGIAAPIASSVSVDDKNSAAYVLNISQSGLGMPDRDYYVEDNERFAEMRTAYKKHVAEMLALAQFDGDANQLAEAIFLFEKDLAQVSMTREAMRFPENTYNKRSMKMVVDMAPALNLASYFSVNEIKFDSAVVNQPNYIAALDNIVAKQNGNTLQAYAVWCTLHAYADYLPHGFVQSDFDFYNTALRGTKKMKPRWKRTISAVENGLGEQLGHLFVAKYFPEESKVEIQNLVENLRTAYRERIKQLGWMSEETKKRALEKLMGFTYKIGYPDTWDKQEGLIVNSNVYLENAMVISAFQIKDNLKKLGKKVDRNEWFMPAHIVNAYYNPSFNEIVFPAGILQPPFYNPAADMAINFGGIGGVIGHEFSHGFDDQGSKYNVEGNLDNWWTAQDSTSFDSRTTKMVRQFDGYQPILESFVNGKLTLGENIADLGGLTLAYYGYKAGLKNGDYKGDTIDGFSWQQRIFLGWGQVWQVNQTDEATRNQVLTDPHSPAQYRVIGPMSNMPEFAQAWGCKAGDNMVRPDSVKVEIW